MLSPDQFHAMRPEIDAYSLNSLSHDDAHVSHPFFKHHDAGHATNPLMKSLGWGNDHQCLYPGCDHEDKSLSDWDSPVMSATPKDGGRWSDHTVNPRSLKLVSHESVVDTEHLSRLLAGVHGKASSEAPTLVPHNGSLHINDGNHRLVAAAIRNEPLNVRVYRGE